MKHQIKSEQTQTTPLDIKPGDCNFPDAFCLIRYESEAGDVAELIWNARDGSTPLSVHTRDRSKILFRKGSVAFEPARVPHAGERIFVNLSMEMASTLAAEVAASNPQQLKLFLSRGGTRKKFIDSLIAQILGNGQKTAIITVSRADGKVIQK